MAFVVRVDVAELPTLADLIDAAGDRLGMDVQADEVTTIAADQGERSTSWCPWPHPRIAIYVPGASTRGVELLATRGRDAAEVVVSVAALATWSDWRLAVAVCQVLAGPSGTLRVEGEGEVLPRTTGEGELWTQGKPKEARRATSAKDAKEARAPIEAKVAKKAGKLRKQRKQAKPRKLWKPRKP